jgi:hypothetical protein
MKVARQERANQDHPISASELVAMVTAGAAEIAGLADKQGSLEIGRPADVLILARCDPEPYESVCAATPNDVELVLIGGGPAYGRTDWIRTLAQNPADPNLEPVLAWGRPMLLDTSYQGQPDGDPTPRLAQLRADLTNTYPPRRTHLGPNSRHYSLDQDDLTIQVVGHSYTEPIQDRTPAAQAAPQAVRNRPPTTKAGPQRTASLHWRTSSLLRPSLSTRVGVRPPWWS